MTLKTKSPAIIFHKEIRPAEGTPENAPVLVSQNFFRLGDRFHYVENERVDKYVTEEFLTNAVYGCQVVLTNPTSNLRKLDVLLQIPRGALPVKGGFYTKGLPIRLRPYSTFTFEYHFYFPSPGTFPHYPVHVAKNGKLLAFAPAASLKVVDMPTIIDKTSWQYISQDGSPRQVLDYLNENNIGRLNMVKIAFRMSEKAFFSKTINLLRARHEYDRTLWSYSILHNDLPAIREYPAPHEQLRRPVRRLYRLSAHNHRPHRAAYLSAYGIQPIGKRPRPSPGQGPAHTQRSLLRPIHAPDEGTQLPPRPRRRRRHERRLLYAPTGPCVRGDGLLLAGAP